MAKKIVKKKIRVAKKLEFSKLNREEYHKLLLKNSKLRNKILENKKYMNKKETNKEYFNKPNNYLKVLSPMDIQLNELKKKLLELDKVLDEHLHQVCNCNKKSNKFLVNRKTTRNNDGS